MLEDREDMAALFQAFCDACRSRMTSKAQGLIEREKALAGTRNITV
jgi:hypothetical protein